jgi:hypothetical protein
VEEEMRDRFDVNSETATNLSMGQIKEDKA